MNASELQTRFAYNTWANRRLLAAARVLPPDELVRDLGASFGSVHGTLVHILSGERRWLRFWQDGTLLAPLSPRDAPTLEDLDARWRTVAEDQAGFIGDLTAERLAALLPVDGHGYALGELVQHLLNHSTYHRGQVAVLLRQLGHRPPATDYRLFLTEAG